MKRTNLFKTLMAGAVLSSGLAMSASSTLAAKNFTDLANNNSHNESVKYLNNLDAYDYKTGNKLNGNQPITRAEVIEILHTVFTNNLDKIRHYENNFTDVNDNTAHAEEIIWSYEMGIIDGSNGKFNPNQTLTRAQMAKILVTMFNLESTKRTEFSDTMGHWAMDYISTLASLGYAKGTGNNKFNPNGQLTLNEFSTFLYRIMQDNFEEKAVDETQGAVNEKETVDETQEAKRTEIKKIEGSTYQSIVMFDAPTDDSHGTGFIIGKNKLLTNKHVVELYEKELQENKNTVVVRLKDDTGNFLDFQIKSITHAPTGEDLSLIEVTPTDDGRNISDNVEIFEFASREEIENVKIGDMLQTTGYPGDKEKGTLWEVKGEFLGDLVPGGNIITFDAKIAGGASGSPLLNKDGKLVGLVNSYDEKDGKDIGMGFLLTDELYTFIENNR